MKRLPGLPAWKDLLSTLLLMLSLWVFLRSINDSEEAEGVGEGKKKRIQFLSSYLSATALFVCAALSKPSTVVAPFIVALLLYVKKDRRTTSYLLMVPRLMIAVFLRVDNPLGTTGSCFRAHGSLVAAAPRCPRCHNILPVQDHLAVESLFGLLSSPLLGHQPRVGANYGVIACCFVFHALFWRKKQPIYLSAFLLFIFSLTPSLGLITFNYQFVSTVADRYVYFSMVIPCVLFCLCCQKKHEQAFIPLFILLSAILAIKSHFQLRHWATTVSVRKQAVDVNPESFIAHNDLSRRL